MLWIGNNLIRVARGQISILRSTLKSSHNPLCIADSRLQPGTSLDFDKFGDPVVALTPDTGGTEPSVGFMGLDRAIWRVEDRWDELSFELKAFLSAISQSPTLLRTHRLCFNSQKAMPELPSFPDAIVESPSFAITNTPFPSFFLQAFRIPIAATTNSHRQDKHNEYNPPPRI